MRQDITALEVKVQLPQLVWSVGRDTIVKKGQRPQYSVQMERTNLTQDGHHVWTAIQDFTAISPLVSSGLFCLLYK